MISSNTLDLPYKRILLTGGDGFVGHYLGPMLAKANPYADCLAITRSATKYFHGAWKAAQVDISDEERIKEIIKSFQPDLLIHMAAQSSVSQGHSASEETWNVNFGGTFALAKAVAAFVPNCTFFFTSSSEVYGLSLRDGPVDETAPLQPMNCYARSKAAAEQMLLDIIPKTSQLIIARAFNHLGSGQSERFVMASFAGQISRIEAGLQPPLLTIGNIDVARDFLDVRDVCEAYIEMLRIAPTLKAPAIFNVSTGKATTIREALDILKSYARKDFKIEIDTDRLRPNDIPSASGLNEKLCRETGWKPHRPLEQTLHDLLDGARSLKTH